MEHLQHLLDNNRAWARKAVERDPEFFSRLVKQQSPEYLWIGCSDSRVPANEIVGMQPGELFVHRNVANVVSHSDVNAQSVIQFAVDVLKVKHIIVVGHYGCSGVRTALCVQSTNGIADYWLGHVRDVACRHSILLAAEPNEMHQASLLGELNVLEQAINVCSSFVVKTAWERGQELTVHGWIYGLSDGLVRHLDFNVSGNEDLSAVRERAIEQILIARKRRAEQRLVATALPKA